MDRPPPPRAAIIVHAGAWAIPDGEVAAHREGCLAAVEAGWQTLESGGRAVDAVKAAVRVLEADERLNAGRGSVLNLDGEVEMDAGIMDGTDLSAGGVAGLRRFPHPIDGADTVRESKHVVLIGHGAERYLSEAGVLMCDPHELVTPREADRLAELREQGEIDGTGTDFGIHQPGDTVGAVAIDHIGRIAAGASTGGICGKFPGRMGDTPVPGGGFFADNLAGGAACTGWGEPILRMGLTRHAVDLLRSTNAQDASWASIKELESRFSGKGGVIAIGRDGSIGFSFNTPKMAIAYRDAEMAMPQLAGGISASCP